MSKIKTPITDAFIKWRKRAAKEELKKFSEDANNLASSLRTAHKLSGCTICKKS